MPPSIPQATELRAERSVFCALAIIFLQEALINQGVIMHYRIELSRINGCEWRIIDTRTEGLVFRAWSEAECRLWVNTKLRFSL